MMKQKFKKLWPLLLFAVIFAAVTLLIYYNAHRIFVFLEEQGFLREEIAFEVAENAPQTLEQTLDELVDDPRVTVDQSLMLINTAYTLSERFVPQITEYKDTEVYMNACMPEAYAALSAAVTAEMGKKLYVSSDFRTAEEQKELYLADSNTATRPGASEHQSGLCVDVYVAYYAGDGFLKSPAGRFVNRACYKYGFIIRYPSYGEDETGIRFEPWHIRYVGHPHADVIYGNRLTLEEYILSMEIGAWYEADGYLISRQSMVDGKLSLPATFTFCVISPDNTGHYILTIQP